MIDFRNLFNKLAETVHEGVRAIVDNEVEINTVLPARQKSLSELHSKV